MENKKIRIGNDVTLKVKVTRLGQPEDIANKNAKLLLRVDQDTVVLPYLTEDDIMTAVYYGSDQHKLGPCSIIVVESINDRSRNVVDKRNAFVLVPSSESENIGLTGPQTVDIDLDISVPSNGLSAYETAVLQGFKGSEEEWVASLAGEKGDKGDSAYQQWLDAGNIGTPNDFLKAIKGPKGDPGNDGRDGHLSFPEFSINSEMQLVIKSPTTYDDKFKVEDGVLYFKQK